MDTPNFKLAMGSYTNPNFTPEEVENFITSIYNGSFTDVKYFMYEPKNQAIIFNVEEILDQQGYDEFWNKVKESKYWYLFFPLN